MADARQGSPAARGGFPVAGLAALALVLVLDRWGLAREQTWAWFAAQQPVTAGLAPGLVRDRVELFTMDRLITAAPRHEKVAVLGTSRARRGLQNTVMGPAAGERVHVYKLAHAGMQPYEILALVDDLIASQVHVAVLVLSEFDTHRPLRLDPVTGSGSLTAWTTLFRAGGWPLVREQRTELLRLGLACLLDSYRYREVFRDVGAEDFFGLPLLERRVALAQRPGSEDSPPYRRALALVEQEWPEISAGTVRGGLDQVLSVDDGPHVAIQFALIDEAVRRLTEAGVDVLLLEMPLSHLATRLNFNALDEAFGAFARGLEQRHELVEFVPRARLGRLAAEDFVDLTHLSTPAALRVSESVGAMIKRTVVRRRARLRNERAPGG